MLFMFAILRHALSPTMPAEFREKFHFFRKEMTMVAYNR